MNIFIIGLLFQVSMLAARPKLTGPSANLGAAYLCEQQGLNKDIHSMGNINTNIFGTPNNYEVIGTTKRLKLKVQKGKDKIHDGAKKFQRKIKSTMRKIRHDEINDEYIQVDHSSLNNMAAPSYPNIHGLTEGNGHPYGLHQYRDT